MADSSEIIETIRKALIDHQQRDQQSITKVATLLRADDCENPLSVEGWLPMGASPITHGTVIVDGSGRVCAPDITSKVNGADIGRLTADVTDMSMRLFDWADKTLDKLNPTKREVIKRLRKISTRHWVDDAKSSTTRFSHIGQKVEDFIKGKM